MGTAPAESISSPGSGRVGQHHCERIIENPGAQAGLPGVLLVACRRFLLAAVWEGGGLLQRKNRPNVRPGMPSRTGEKPMEAEVHAYLQGFPAPEPTPTKIPVRPQWLL
jgi:hypothetical protein